VVLQQPLGPVLLLALQQALLGHQPFAAAKQAAAAAAAAAAALQICRTQGLKMV
jgi:hypothetical protein